MGMLHLPTAVIVILVSYTENFKRNLKYTIIT